MCSANLSVARITCRAHPVQDGGKTKRQGAGNRRKQQVLFGSRAARKQRCSPIVSCSEDTLHLNQGHQTQPAACTILAAFLTRWH